jgi:hypothetical protein
MPLLLPRRLKVETPAGFREAARERFLDGCALADTERGLAAIYLWGYAAEMLLKAAYFKVDGHGDNEPITLQQVRNAVRQLAQTTYRIIWPAAGDLHNVARWAELLVLHRQTRGLPYANPPFADDVRFHAEAVYDRWRETLRYHPNRAYQHEVNRVRSATNWLLDHELLL